MGVDRWDGLPVGGKISWPGMARTDPKFPQTKRAAFLRPSRPINPSGSGGPWFVPGIHRQGPGITLLLDRAGRDSGVRARFGQRKSDVDTAIGAQPREID